MKSMQFSTIVSYSSENCLSNPLTFGTLLMKGGLHPTLDDMRHYSDRWTSEYTWISVKIFFSWNDINPSACLCCISVKYKSAFHWQFLKSWWYGLVNNDYFKKWLVRLNTPCHRSQDLLSRHPPRVNNWWTGSTDHMIYSLWVSTES